MNGHRRRTPAGSVAALCLVLCLVPALAGCGSGTHDASTSPATTASRSSTTATPSTAPLAATKSSSTATGTGTTSATTGAGSGDDHEHDGVDPSGAPEPTPLNSAEAARWREGTRIAEAFLRAWAPRPGDTKDAWLARVMPYLTEEGRGTYTGVWPIQGVWTTVTGPAKVRPWADPTANSLDLPVAVPTDVGVITVHIDPEKMLVATFDLPGQE